MVEGAPAPRTYVVVMWDWTKSLPASRRLRAYDAADAKTQADLIMCRALSPGSDGKLTPTCVLKGIEPYEEKIHGEPPWFR